MCVACVVEHRHTGEVWLEGNLERGIVPENCVWMAGQGTAEEGFLLLLHKMNLELLRRCARCPRPAAVLRRPALVAVHRLCTCARR